MFLRFAGFLVLAGTAAALAGPAHAEDAPSLRLGIRNHMFVPQALTVPAGHKIKLIVKNEDSTAAEFESYELNREKIVPAASEVPIFIGPLDPGTYPFFDDFHRETTTGEIVAK